MLPRASGISSPIAQYKDNSRGLRAGNQPQKLFGEAVAIRGIVTSDAIRNLFEAYQSIDEMKAVFMHPLEDTDVR